MRCLRPELRPNPSGGGTKKIKSQAIDNDAIAVEVVLAATFSVEKDSGACF